MKVYFIHPYLTLGKCEQAENFYDICYGEIEEYVEIVNIKTEVVMLSIDIAPESIVIFFNRSDQNYTSKVTAFLNSAFAINAKFVPIAISKEHRSPPIEPKISSQSFDIIEALRQRRLTNANINTVAFALSRKIICETQPTLSKEDMQIFISYRRIDGEDLAALFYNEFQMRAESAFRDLIDIKIGENAQDVIEETLKKSDVVVFIDTPKSGESFWIRRELSIALSLNIPIVWVRVGDLDQRTILEVKPADTPHFYYDNSMLREVSSNSELVDNIIHKAFLLSRNSAEHVFEKIHLLKNMVSNYGLTFNKLDSRNMIYRIEIPRNGFRYYQKPLVQIVQCYGRRPKEAECSRIVPILEGFGYITHPEYGSYYDTTIFLSPIGESVVSSNATNVTESFDSYLYHMEKFLNPEKYKNPLEKGIIISGAFPDCEPEYQQYLTDAVYSLTKSIIKVGGKVIFGAHPTFQHLIFDMARMQMSDKHKDAIRVYVSKYFVTEAFIEEMKVNAQVFATEVVENSRSNSLTLMRKQMISDEYAIGLVCMGGKTKSDTHQPGIDEEIAIAKERGIPIFIIGSVGGRSSEIAQYYNSNNWSEKINDLSIEENIELMTSIDYESISNIILNSLGL